MKTLAPTGSHSVDTETNVGLEDGPSIRTKFQRPLDTMVPSAENFTNSSSQLIRMIGRYNRTMVNATRGIKSFFRDLVGWLVGSLIGIPKGA